MKNLVVLLLILNSGYLYAGPANGTIGGGVGIGGGGNKRLLNNEIIIRNDQYDSFFRAMKKEEIDSSGLLRAARQTGKIPNEIQFFMNEENDSEVEEIRVLTNFSDIESIKLKDGRVIHFSDRKFREKLELYSR